MGADTTVASTGSQASRLTSVERQFGPCYRVRGKTGTGETDGSGAAPGC